MARLLTIGGEWNDWTAEGAVSLPAGISTSSANPRTGTYAWRSTATGNSVLFAFPGATATTYYLRGYFSASAFQAVNNLPLLLFLQGTVTGIISLLVSPTGHIVVRDVQGTTDIATSTDSVSASSYFMVELAYSVGVGATDYVEARLNGSSFYSSSTLNLSDTAPTRIGIFGGDGTVTVDGDDLALNDSTGASQNSWPGSGKVVLALPISDNARTAGWVTGAGGTTSLFDAVNNTPPVGVADTGTATSQIRDATSEASASYDANLTTYTNLGIASGDTINVVVPMVATAAPVTTSAKQGLIGMASNPAITTVALSATGTSGAFWAGATAGTYPTGWKWSKGTTTYAPSVTKGSSPVARITQVTSSTRIADVCALGMYIDYTPAAPTTPPPPTVKLQAVNRASCW